MNRMIVGLALLSLGACTAPEIGTIHPELAFTIGAEAGLTGARDLTVDGSGNVFVFDYDDYVISKFGPSGEALGTFGGPESEGDGFQHLMAIRALGDSLLALDAGSLSVFDLSGRLLDRRPYADTVTCDLPRLHPGGAWAGEWIDDVTAKKILTYRGGDGGEQARVASYDLGEIFPGVEPGGFFFISPNQARSYLYDFFPDGRLVWAASDAAQVLSRADGTDQPLYSADWTPIPFPPDEIQSMRERQEGLSPPLFMNVPESYQLIQHLLVDENGELWFYAVSQERTGFLHLSERGREMGFYAVEADFDLLSARVTAAGGRLYFMVAGREETRIYVAERP